MGYRQNVILPIDSFLCSKLNILVQKGLGQHGDHLHDDPIFLIFSFSVQDQKPDDLLVLGGWNHGHQGPRVAQQVAI